MQPQQYYPPQPPQSYAPQYAPPTQTAPLPTAAPANPFTNPGQPGGGLSPRAQDMDGCLVALSPRSFSPAGAPDNVTGFEGGPPRDRVTVDIYLLETPNGPIAFGGYPETRPNHPHTHTVAGPAKFTGAYINNQNIVAACAPGGVAQVGALILGRIERSKVGRMPWNLVVVDGTPDMDKAVQIWSAIQMGQVRYNEPQPIPGVGPQPAAANSVSYGQPVSNVGYPTQQPVYAQPSQPYVPPAVQQAFPQAQPVAPQQPTHVFTGGAPAPAPMPPPPPGWQPQMWAGLTDQQRAQVLSQVAPPQQ